MSPSAPDRTVVARHLLALDEALQRLSRHTDHSRDELATDTDLRWAVERGLQLAAQNTLDIATHLAAAAGRDAPDYASSIDRLGELGVLPAEFARDFRKVAGFRNVLVHAYLAVDLDIVHQLLTSGLEDFRVFAKHVQRYLDD